MNLLATGSCGQARAPSQQRGRCSDCGHVALGGFPNQEKILWSRTVIVLPYEGTFSVINVHPSYMEDVVSSHRVTSIVKAGKTRDHESLASKYVLCARRHCE